MRLQSPYDPAHYIDLPDKWIGIHAKRHDDALAAGSELPATWRNFATAMALLDDWNLPGVAKNADLWDFAELGLPLMVWVSTAVFQSYNRCYEIPKNSLPPLSNRSAMAARGDDGPGKATP